ncbi:ATP-citrate synthase, citrate-binding domain, partial [Dillenia turbinata]
MVAGSGASIIYADISGAPNEKEVLQYARCATVNPDGRKRALLISGGIANFTDVASEFRAIIRALREKESKLKAVRMHMYVKMGGPNYPTLLVKMRVLGEEVGVPLEVYGPVATMIDICKQAIDCIMTGLVEPLIATSATFEKKTAFSQECKFFTCSQISDEI